MRTDRCEVSYTPDPTPPGATGPAPDAAPDGEPGLRAAPAAVAGPEGAAAPGATGSAAAALGAVPPSEAGLRAAPAAGSAVVSDPDGGVAAPVPEGARPAVALGAVAGRGSGLRVATAVSGPDDAATPETSASPDAATGPAAEAVLRVAPATPPLADSGADSAVVATAHASGTQVQGPGVEGDSLAPLLGWALRALAAVGALTVGDGQATLTPLGSWAVWVKLEQICVAAQSPAGNIEQSAEDMLRGCAQLRPNAARAEYRAWLAARPVGSAVTELLGAARGEDALLRGLAFEALRVVGAPAEPDVRAVLDEPALRPYALLWLAEHDGVDAEDAHEVLTREEATWLWVDTAAAVTDHGEASMLVRHLEAAVQPTVPMLLDEVRTVGHPRTVQVLVALAAAHPDPALAKALRRAAFQVHTGGN
ncbi:hypothetical protein ACF09J_02820 [Streptomyces sp. NPDC014889]|uniref:hypothetical protein n=1 Tax=Streptomyces sp. NPDC014889 TaxID=3364928 RepID=UPI0036FE6990